FFSSEKFIKALNYCVSAEFLSALNGNKYAYPYNSPAFEMTLVFNVFGSLIDSRDDLKFILESQMKKQMDLTYDPLAKMLNINTEDSLTLSSRIYEYLLGLDTLRGSI